MNRLLLIPMLFMSIMISAQNLFNTAFDTNGPMGELLFEQNEDGEIIYSGIVDS